MKTKTLLNVLYLGILPSTAAATIQVNSSSFNPVTNAAILTAGTSDWGFVSSQGSFFGGTPYNNTPYSEITDASGNNLTTTSSASSIGEVTLTEGTSGTDTVNSQNNVSNYTFETTTNGITNTSAAFGSYGNFAPGEQNAWQITFNDLGVGRHAITLYLGHSNPNRSFSIDVSDGSNTVSGAIGSIGSTIAGIGDDGFSFTYDLDITTTNASDDVTLTLGDVSPSQQFGGAIFAGYTVTNIGVTNVPEPTTSAFLGLVSLIGLGYRKR